MKALATSATAAALLFSVAGMSASSAPTEAEAGKQRVAIELKRPLNRDSGTFVLHPKTPGSLKLDFGPFTQVSIDNVFNDRIRDGQSVDRYREADSLEGNRGTLVIHFEADFVSAGNGFTVGAGTWSVFGGTSAYSGLSGGGRAGFVRTPRKLSLAQLEGWVTS